MLIFPIGYVGLKNNEPGAVEDYYDNMVSFHDDEPKLIGKEFSFSVDGRSYKVTIPRYALIIFKIQAVDAGTYKCKALSYENSNTNVTLGKITIAYPPGNAINNFQQFGNELYLIIIIMERLSVLMGVAAL